MIVKQFKSDYSGAFAQIDLDHPYYHLNTGLFELPLDGEFPAQAFVYIPEETTNSCWSIALLLPNGKDVQGFLLESGWKALADREKIVLFLGQAVDGWTGTMEDVSFVEALRAKLDVRDHYVTQVFFAYLAGYDEGATVALKYTMRHPSAYAGVAFAGDFSFGAEEERSARNAPAALPYLPACDVPVPAYFQSYRWSASLEKAYRHFQSRNNADPNGYEHERRTVSPALQSAPRDTVNGQPVASVIADIDAFDSSLCMQATEELWRQVHRTIRTTGVGPGGLHAYRTLDELGITTHEMKIDGYVHHWCEYVPKRAVSRLQKKPVVVFLHGGTQVAESGLYASEWFNVAESRDFIALFPSGGMAQTRLNANPMPTWNIACKGKEDLYVDDEAFIRAMIADVAKRLPVDLTRVYVNGHSMGSGMVQRCLFSMPDIFAAGVSNSGVTLGEYDLPGTKTDYDVATWIEIGEHDVDSYVIDESPLVKKNLEYWIARGDLQPLEQAGSYSCGRYQHKIWRNEAGVPMLKFTAAHEKTHCTMPQDAWSYYDDFLCKFSRNPDGSLGYCGQPVRRTAMNRNV